MWIKILAAISTFFFAYYSAKKNANDDKSKKIAKVLIGFGIISLAINLILTYQDNIKSISQQEKIEELLSNTRTANDSISYLKSSVGVLKDKLDSNQIINTEIKRTSIPTFKERIMFSDEEETNKYFNGILEEGMKVKVTRNNCLNNVSIMINEKPIIIEENSGLWETIILETSKENEAFLRYQGGAPCALTIEIYLSPKPKFPNNKISLITQEPDVDNNLANLGTCVLEDIEENLKGSWLLKLKYHKCNNKQKQKWNDNLVVFFKIKDFKYSEQNGYEINGYSYGEELNNEYKQYSKSYKINEKNGFLYNQNKKSDCYIKIPYHDDSGYIKLVNIEYIEERIFLYGTFLNYQGICEGEVEMINTSQF